MAKYLDETGVSTLWGKVKDLGTATAQATVQTIIGTKGKAQGIASLDDNGYVPLSQLGNLDTTFAEVVTELPTSGIKKHLYLLKSTATDDNNNYAEYLYTGDVTATYDASKWEKLGEFKADVDLSGYAKKSEALGSFTFSQSATTIPITQTKVGGGTSTAAIQPASSTQAGVMTAADKTKLDGIASGANAYSLPLAASGTRGGIQVGFATSGKNYAVQLSNEKAYVNVPWTDTHYASSSIVGASNTATGNAAATNGNVYLNHIENGAVKSAHKISGSGATTVTSDASGNVTISSTNTTYSAVTSDSAGLMTPAILADLQTAQTKLNGIASGAEVNQNAFSNVVVGTTTIASGAKTANLTLAGSNVTLTPDATNKKVTIGLTKANVTSALGYTPPTQDTNTYTNKAAFTAKDETVLMTLTLSNGSTVTAEIPAASSDEDTGGAGVMSVSQMAYIKGIAQAVLDISAITDTELAKILV